MGAGKSFLGRILAEQLGFQFIDLDEFIEAKAGAPIAGIFQKSGETGFREMEASCLRDLTSQQQIVVSTGGGCPCFHGNMEWMNENGITVYFCADTALLVQRLLPEKAHRPLIADVPTEELAGFIESKMSERTSFYEKSHLKFLVPHQGTQGLDELGKYLRRFFT